MTNLDPSLRRPVRVRTIVWGALLLAIAGVALLSLAFGPLTSVGVLWVIVGFGSALVLAAITTAAVRAARQHRADRSSTEDL